MQNETGMKTELRSRDELLHFGLSGFNKEISPDKVNAFAPVRLEADQVQKVSIGGGLPGKSRTQPLRFNSFFKEGIVVMLKGFVRIRMRRV